MQYNVLDFGLRLSSIRIILHDLSKLQHGMLLGARWMVYRDLCNLQQMISVPLAFLSTS